MNAAQLTVESWPVDVGTLIKANGEVDLTTAPHLRQPIMEAINNSARQSVIVDLSQVDFIDSAGLAVLVEARKQLAPKARVLHVLLTRGRQPERVLKLGRFDTIITLIYSLDELTASAQGV